MNYKIRMNDVIASNLVEDEMKSGDFNHLDERDVDAVKHLVVMLEDNDSRNIIDNYIRHNSNRLDGIYLVEFINLLIRVSKTVIDINSEGAEEYLEYLSHKIFY